MPKRKPKFAVIYAKLDCELCGKDKIHKVIKLSDHTKKKRSPGSKSTT